MRLRTLKRVLFLLLVGLLNCLIFPPDIIHYYAFYFFFALWFLRSPAWVLWLAIFSLIFISLVLIIVLDFDTGWNWETLSYAGFWTPTGFIRNLFYNGWHPVLPWLAFVLFGIWLSRLPLREHKLQSALFIFGWGLFVLVMILSYFATNYVTQHDAEAAILFGTASVPALPLYMLAGSGFACGVIGTCLLLEPALRNAGILHILTRPGRMSLTLYVAHIIIGMGALEAMGLLGGQPQQTAYIAAGLFCAFAVVVALIWNRFFRYGPLEAMLRAFSR